MIAAAPLLLAGAFTTGAFGYMFDYFLWCILFASLVVHTYCFFRLFPRKRLPRTGLVLGNGLVFLCMIGTVALLAESYLRFVAVYTDSFGVSLPARRWFALYTNLNSFGCRDPEWSMNKRPGVRRIAFVGDSYTYGWGIERVEDRFSDLLRERFDLRNSGSVQVMNVAKPGWGTSDEVAPIRDMIERFGVDEIVLCYVPNDIEPLIPVTDEFDPTRPPDYQFMNLDSSPLLDYLYRRMYLPFLSTVRDYHNWLAKAFTDRDIWEKHEAQLREIATMCRANGVTLRVVILPFLITTGKEYQAAGVHTQVRSLLYSMDVATIDLRDVLEERGVEPRTLVVNSLDAHPNESAQVIFAEALWNAWYANEPHAPFER